MGKAFPNPFTNELRALPRTDSPSVGRSVALGPVQAGELHSHRFMDLPPPAPRPAFALGRCFARIPFIASLAALNRTEPQSHQASR